MKKMTKTPMPAPGPLPPAPVPIPPPFVPGSPGWVEAFFKQKSKEFWDAAEKEIEDAEALRDDQDNKLYEREVG